jgi:hypothetical protein
MLINKSRKKQKKGGVLSPFPVSPNIYSMVNPEAIEAKKKKKNKEIALITFECTNKYKNIENNKTKKIKTISCLDCVNRLANKNNKSKLNNCLRNVNNMRLPPSPIYSKQNISPSPSPSHLIPNQIITGNEVAGRYIITSNNVLTRNNLRILRRERNKALETQKRNISKLFQKILQVIQYHLHLNYQVIIM